MRPSAPRRRLFAALAVLPALAAAGLIAPSAVAAARHQPVVIHDGLVTRQDIGARGTSEPNTVVEPDVAVSPVDHDVAIAVAHDSRYADGGAVTITAAYTSDGGATWTHHAVPGITTATGGPYDRASDPVVAFGPGGIAYLSVLVFDTGCPTAVAVLTSRDGGASWSAPHYVQRSSRCSYSDDKNWLVVDTNPASPHLGRVYQFWTPFLSRHGRYFGSPQVVRWSDDQGSTWSSTHYVVRRTLGTQNSQPMIEPDGTIVDTFYDYGVNGRSPDATIDPTGTIVATTSTDGGSTWSRPTIVTVDGGGYAPGVRCCLFAADIDPVTHRMYVAWMGGVGSTDPVYVAQSDNGTSWSSPVRVSYGDKPGVQRVNVDVVARAGDVYVSYGTRRAPGDHGGFVQQQVSTSTDRGASFGPPLSIGPVSVLRYAARADGYFPGDYIGEAIAPGRLYVVYANSSKPYGPDPTTLHQVIWGTTLRP